MKKKFSATLHFLVSFVLTVVCGLAFINNVSAIVAWWRTFYRLGGDATLIPNTSAGILPWLDWSVVDYSGVTTFIPFLGFLLITLGLARALTGRRQDPEQFPFFHGYDQLNIALGLIGTLWGIIIIGYFQMETVTMGNLMMCLHTALFSTLMAVVWVFIIDHSVLRPLALRVLRTLQGTEHEDEDILEVLDKLSESAGGLCDVWKNNRDQLSALNDGIALANSELLELGGVGRRVADTFSSELTGAAKGFVTQLDAAATALEVRQEKMETAWAEQQKQMAAAQAGQTALIEGVTGLVSGVQTVQERLAAATEHLQKENATLSRALADERRTSDALRGTVAETKGESEGRLRQINELIEKMRETESAFNARLDQLRDTSERLAAEKGRVEGDRQRALDDAEAAHRRSDKAEKLLERIRSTFSA